MSVLTISYLTVRHVSKDFVSLGQESDPILSFRKFTVNLYDIDIAYRCLKHFLVICYLN